MAALALIPGVAGTSGGSPVGNGDGDTSNVTVVGTTLVDDVINQLRQATDTINGLDASDFKNRRMRRALTNKINASIRQVEEASSGALDKLENDILAKTDGCAVTGAAAAAAGEVARADPNDWIVTCAAQRAAFPHLKDAVDIFKALMKKNFALAIGWRGFADLDLRFSEFFNGDHTITMRFIAQYPHGYEGPVLAENGSGTYFIGQGNFNTTPQGKKVRVRIGGNTQNVSAPFFGPGIWQNLAVVRSGNTIQVYHAGVAFPPMAVSPTDLPNGTLRLGRRTDGGFVNGTTREAQFYGLIDDVAVFDRALSPAEIQQTVSQRLTGNEGLSGFPVVRSMLAYWTFDWGTPSGGTLPAWHRNADFKSLTPGLNPAYKQRVSDNGTGNVDGSLVPLPFNQVEWRLPFAPGQAWRVTQGNSRPAPSHNGGSAFAWDFALASGAPSCGERLFAVAGGRVIRFQDIDLKQNPMPGTTPPAPPLDQSNFIKFELGSLAIKDELATYMHTQEGSIAEALPSLNQSSFIFFGVPQAQWIARVGTRGPNNCHLHLGVSSGDPFAIVSQQIDAVTFPAAFTNYEACDAHLGRDCTDELNWFFVPRGVPQHRQWVRQP